MNTKKNRRCLTEKFFPPGYNADTETGLLVTGLIFSGLYALIRFSIQFTEAKESLYYGGSRKTLIPGARMPDFEMLFQGCLLGFLLMAAASILVAVLHYSYHYRGSKSIYLMRRLPDPKDFLRRCLAVPILILILAAASAFLLTLLSLGIYLLDTPNSALQPDQWQKLWT